MGKKPVLGIVSAFCVGFALTGCQNCPSCHSDGARLAKENQIPVKPATSGLPAAATTSGLPTAATTTGWNNSGTPLPKPSVDKPLDAPTPIGMEKTGPRAADPLATSKPEMSGVQPANFTPPPAPDAPALPETNTSHFLPTAGGRILPSPPALATGSSLPPLPDERPFPAKVEESTALPPPPPPPPPTLKHSVTDDAPPLSSGTLPPPPPPPSPNS